MAKTVELRAVVQEKLKEATSDDPEYRRSWEYKNLVNAALDLVLEPAFAAVREAGRRTLSMRHFDVQLIGGIVLHQGRIAEMKTGEGKTLAVSYTHLDVYKRQAVIISSSWRTLDKRY